VSEEKIMTRVEVRRSVAADPSSVALVLAGPAARELWPPRSDRIVGVVEPQQPRLAVTVDPPARAGVGFAARIEVHAGDATIGAGRLSIVPGAGEPVLCEVRLCLEVETAAATRLRRDADRYLANVADLSRARSSAA
jgi:hypothetical protein